MVVDELKKAKTQQARTAKVKELEAELKEQAKAVNKSPAHSATKMFKRPRRTKLMSLCENLVQFLEHGNDGDAYTTLEELQFTGGPDLERIKKLIGRLSLRWKVLGL